MSEIRGLYNIMNKVGGFYMKEYRVVHLMSPEPVTASLTSAHLESSLNQEAREGWELKQFIIPPGSSLNAAGAFIAAWVVLERDQ